MIGATLAAEAMAECATLFWQARTGHLRGRVYFAGQTYSVPDTLVCVERELAEAGVGTLDDCPAAHRDLLNILAQRPEWEAEGSA